MGDVTVDDNAERSMAMPSGAGAGSENGSYSDTSTGLKEGKKGGEGEDGREF